MTSYMVAIQSVEASETAMLRQLGQNKVASMYERSSGIGVRHDQRECPPCRSNAPSSNPQLVTKPCVRRFRSESLMPCHEIRKAFDLVGWLHHTHVCIRRGDLPQSAGYGEDQVGASDS